MLKLSVCGGGGELRQYIQYLLKKVTNGSFCESHLQLAINKEVGIRESLTEVLKFQPSDLAHFI